MPKNGQKNSAGWMLSKRQKFVTAVFLLSFGLFASEYLFASYTVAIAFVLGGLTDLFLLGAIYDDLKENPSAYPFILPFLCSLSFGLFYFLAPSRLITRLILTTLYAVGIYSLFLSENIFTVASIRTIALLNSARIVTFIITLISYFFLTNIIFSLRLFVIPAMLLFGLFTFLFLLQALWTYTLETSWTKDALWVGVITLCMVEIASILWFWPTSPTVFAVFMTAVFYILTGLVHLWLDKRLFRNVIWEYVWVALVAFFLVFWFTSW